MYMALKESAPDAWCEAHGTFRDAPKSEDVEDEELRAKLEPFQPAPFDATRIGLSRGCTADRVPPSFFDKRRRVVHWRYES